MSDKMKKRVRFLHCSDIHLDTPFVGLSAEKSEERRRMLRASFVKMMQYVRETKIDIVLMSGDIFDVEYATNDTAEALIREFRGSEDTKFVISPGEHDYYTANPIYSSGRLPKNCYVFADSQLSRFDFDEYNVTVYGWAFMTGSLTENPIYDRQVDDSSRINVVCGYADLNGEVNSGSCPISTSDIKKFGADYYALGSRHAASKFATAGASKYSYSGALECTGFDEPGLGGANLITIDYSEDELTIENKSISFGHVDFKTEELDVTGVNTSNEIINRVTKLISDKKYDKETALRVILVGNVAPSFIVPKNIESNAFGLYYFKLIDKTLPLYDTERYMRDMSVAGQIFREFYKDLTGDDEERRLVCARAFRVALAALEKREIDI
jgi:DNA repair exonuclease SbcCD nuclease subunit